MVFLKAYYDGTAIVLDEPAILAVEEKVQMVLSERIKSNDTADLNKVFPVFGTDSEAQ